MSTLFYIVSAIVVFGGGGYALWYAHKQEKLKNSR
jgi:hypothetical protein